jgi:hypothetical protein
VPDQLVEPRQYLFVYANLFAARRYFRRIVNWITQGRTGTRHDIRTGWREPILISGQGKAAPASYSAGGLVFLFRAVLPRDLQRF